MGDTNGLEAGNAADLPPSTVRAWRTVLLPSLTHCTHWWPTAAARMQSGQMWRSHRTHRV